MTPETVSTLSRQAIEAMFVLSLPIMLPALLLGLVVSLVQAATQINEATLSFLPKLIIVLLALAVAGDWMLIYLIDYTRALIQAIPTLIG